jgi:hypothetical protein
MLVICYGIAKSGSTLAFEVVRGVLTSAGHSQKRVPSAAVKPRGRGNYLAALDRDAVTDLIGAIGPDRIVAAKTHMTFPDEMFGWLEELQAARKLQVVASYRDPRDMCLSLVDAGARAREAGREGFSNIHDLRRAAKLIEAAIPKFRKWGALRGTLRLYYDTVAYDPDEAIDRIERVLGVVADRDAVKKHAFEKSFTQKNKATRNRYEDELNERQKQEMLERFGVFITEVCERNDEEWFSSFRAQMLSGGPGI